MKIICTKCGLVHNNRATEHLKDRLCCYNTVRMVNYEIEERIKSEYAKLLPLPCACGCGSTITSQEPEKLCCRFTLVYAAWGVTDKAEYEAINNSNQEAKEKGIKPIFKSLTSQKDMEIIHKMAKGETVKKKRRTEHNRNEYTIAELNCANVVFYREAWSKKFYALLQINGHSDWHLEPLTMKEHARHIGMKLSCMFTN